MFVKLLIGVLINAITEVNGNEIIDYISEDDKTRKVEEVKEEKKEVKKKQLRKIRKMKSKKKLL